LVMGCVVCTALATSGAFISDLKIGYWLGSTPRHQQRWKFLGIVVSAISVSLALLLIQKSCAMEQSLPLAPNVLPLINPFPSPVKPARVHPNLPHVYPPFTISQET